MTWFLFLLAHLSTVAYALINRSDWGLAACFAINAVCCVASEFGTDVQDVYGGAGGGSWVES
jgi:hypothetical protein